MWRLESSNITNCTCADTIQPKQILISKCSQCSFDYGKFYNFEIINPNTFANKILFLTYSLSNMMKLRLVNSDTEIFEINRDYKGTCEQILVDFIKKNNSTSILVSTVQNFINITKLKWDRVTPSYVLCDLINPYLSFVDFSKVFGANIFIHDVSGDFNTLVVLITRMGKNTSYILYVFDICSCTSRYLIFTNKILYPRVYDRRVYVCMFDNINTGWLLEYDESLLNCEKIASIGCNASNIMYSRDCLRIIYDHGNMFTVECVNLITRRIDRNLLYFENWSKKFYRFTSARLFFYGGSFFKLGVVKNKVWMMKYSSAKSVKMYWLRFINLKNLIWARIYITDAGRAFVIVGDARGSMFIYEFELETQKFLNVNLIGISSYDFPCFSINRHGVLFVSTKHGIVAMDQII